MTVSAETSASELLRLLGAVATTSQEAVAAAAALFASCVRDDGVIQAFGTGHSQGTALEVAGRAGGLVPTNRIALSDLVQFGGEDPSVLADPMLERRGDVAARLYELAAPRPADLFVIASSSGVNSSVVEMAHVVKAAGHPLVAITSVRHSQGVPAKHPSGKRLADLADVTLDNGAPLGDTLLPMPDGTSTGAVSSLSAALLVQMIVAETVRLLLDSGTTPPVYVSNNVPGGHERNLKLEAHYEGRIRRTAN
ncbi:sugar isomerase domain-containing protein [Actinophytocola gossypii]|uniref:Sugar isomerase domain-containing protein n=1 Tax=Actinophytocola gossypii TaxID=2812003 RepID=A0ABT2JF39_9PSEU|nr:sugar isomerase domain-containing protein [Actinophytocola gossypii]MCT2586368.1 sugar isomerase domain-containing protein [Actinophytocola gossypii]